MNRRLVMNAWIPCFLVLQAVAFAQPPKPSVPPPPRVLVTPIIEREIAEGQTFVGTVKPLRKSLVGSAVPGRVEEYLVNEGDRVRKGQPIAKLRTGIIQAELDAAAAELKVRQAELEELENGARPDELDQARARLAIAEANRAFRASNRDRSLRLGQAISREQLEEYTALALQAEGQYEDARATLSLLEEGPRKERIAQARAWVETQTAHVQRLTDQLDRHTMFAPFDGFITAEHTEVGQWLLQGDPVAEVIELDQVDVEIPVLEDYIAELRPGTEARVEISAVGGPNRTRDFIGHVAIINQQADIRARTFPVKIRVDNELTETSALIKAGMFARVTLAVGKPIRALLVPKDAIVLGGSSPVVFAIDSAGDKLVARQVPVTLGAYFESFVQVIGDLRTGQQVVVEGNERLRPGQEVRADAIGANSARSQ